MTRSFVFALSLMVLCSTVSIVSPRVYADGIDDIAAGLMLPDDLEVKVWAKSPLFFNPTSIDVDERGRVWVAEGVNYRVFNNKSRMKLRREKGDRIVIVEDSDGDGVADRSKVFVQDEDLVAPLGVTVAGRHVLVACSPRLLVFERDESDRMVGKRTLLEGFGGFDHDHSLHRVELGPDGNWYFNVGNAGPHKVTDRSGWNLRSGSWYTGGTPYNKTNQAGLRSDDGRVYPAGVAFRVEPTGRGLHVIGYGFRNPYGMAVDSFGDVWMNDNDDTQSCRSTWLMRYGDCGYSSKDGTRSWQADRRPRQSIRSAHWRQDDPGVIPSGHVYGNGAPTGMTYFEGESLGERYAGGLLISCEAGQNVVWGYHRKEDGAGFELDGFSFLSTTKSPDPNYRWSHLEKDKRKWFRPSDAAVGISGEVFIADWYDQVVGGHKMNDPDGLGAIYRVVRKGTKPKPKAIDYSTVSGMHEALLNPAPAVRHRGLMSLSQFGARGVELLADHIVEGDRPYYRARYLWLLSRLGEGGQERLLDYANDADPKIRLVVYRALRDTKHGLDLAKRFARDPSPAVRREVALSMRDRSLDESTDILYAIAEQYRDRDRFYLEALGTGCDGKEEALYPIFLAKLGSPTPSWTDAFADIVWRLHPATAVPALRERALSSWLTHVQRKQAIDSLAFISDSRAAKAMSEIAKKGPIDLRFYATYWLKHRAKNAWSGTEIVKEARKKEPKLKGNLLAESPVLKKGGVDIEADITGAKNLWLIVADGGDGKSCDWADWVNPVLIDAKGEETPLAQLNWVSAVTGYGNVLSGKNCRGDDLRVGGVKYTHGIGTHADSTVHYDISRGGYVKFRAHVGPDNGGRDTGGADHASGRASVQFRVFGDGPTAMDRALALRKIALDRKQKLDVRLDAARRLAGTAAGGQVLIGLTASRKLPKELAAAVSETIFRNPDLSVRALASQYFRRPGSASKLAVPDLLKLKGNSARGKKIFFGAKASCSKCHRRGSDGSDVGPDLSKIREKFDAAGLFDAVLNPSAAILSGYEAHTVVTKDGRSFSGRIIADGKTVVLKDTEGKEQRIAKSAILLREASKVSLMPDNVGAGLSAAELADLISYLRSE